MSDEMNKPRKIAVPETEAAPFEFDPEQYVMIARYLMPAEAQMAKGVLESASLECFLHGENANSLVPPAFRSRLMVHRKDEEAAKKLLDTPAEMTAGVGDDAGAGDDEE
ncbi:MAG: DUF2007 domain-containing protein [Edaphobacter sp.]|uniref:putative signal transducing protein n=1 Tax=Edaphobacter sp. TaxID=1934404 RepID=UPI00238E2577|nr:DUF2007 domain-containing protein [Edaphobacter sp.]MDE1176126.1 DUF2007 domain-containing protein [Edaphobacter sp.]